MAPAEPNPIVALNDPAAPTADASRTGSYTPLTRASADGSATDEYRLPVSVAQYEVRRLLGQGGMGAVYLAWDRTLKRVVALKVIRADRAREKDLQRFLHEAEAMAQLSHAGIVQVYEIGRWESPDGLQPYIALEYVEGTTLSRRLAGTPQPPAEAASLVRMLADAIAYAHRKGVLHRDLKPANVLLDDKGRPKIADFGLAKRLDDDSGQTQHGAVLGTPSYMAPEQADGKPVDQAADIWALGAILYECLTGRPPFKGASVPETLRLVVATDPVSPRQMQPAVPRDLETICLKCLRKDARSRYTSAEALSEDLTHFANGEPIAARPIGNIERLWKWARRHPGTAASLAALFVALTAGSIISAILGLRADDRRKVAEEKSALAIEKTTLANANAQLAKDNETKATDALKKNDLTSVRSWMQRLGYRSGPLREAEEIALWDIARADDDRKPMLFLEDALKDKTTAERLARRSEWVVHAICGFHADRRARVLQLLAGRLNDGQTDIAIRESCLELGAALPIHDEAFARAAATTIRKALAQTNDLGRIIQWMQLFAVFAPDMPKDEATLHATAIHAQFAQTFHIRVPSPILTRALHAFGTFKTFLPPDEAGKSVASLLAGVSFARARDYDPEIRHALEDGLAALMRQLSPAVARAAAEQSVVQLERRKQSEDIDELGAGLDRLIPWMLPADRNRIAGQAISALLAAAARDTGFRDANQMYRLASDLALVLEPAAAADAADRVLAQMAGKAKRQDVSKLAGLGRLLDTLLERMPAVEAAARAENAAGRLVDALNATTTPYEQGSLAKAWVRLVQRWPPADTQQRAEAAAQRLAAQMAKSTDPELLEKSAEALGAILEALDPERATQIAEPIAKQLHDALAKTPVARSQSSLANGCASLLARIKPEEAASRAADILEKLVQAIGRIGYPASPEMRALQYSADRLAPLIIAPHLRTTSVKLLEIAQSSFRPDVPSTCGRLLLALAGRMNATTAYETLNALLPVLTQARPVIGGNQAADQAYAVLAGKVSPAEAATLAFKCLDAAQKTSFEANQRTLLELLAAMANRMDSERAPLLRDRLYPMLLKEKDAWTFIALALASQPAPLTDNQRALFVEELQNRLSTVDEPRDVKRLADIADRVARQMKPDAAHAFMTRISLQPLVNWRRFLEENPERQKTEATRSPRAFRADRSWDMERSQASVVRLAPWLAPAQRLRTAAYLVDHLARNEESNHQALFRKTLAELVGGMETAALVELLKRPTCIGPARVVVLRELARELGSVASEKDAVASFGAAAMFSHYPNGNRACANLWEVADRVRAKGVAIDLLAPPIFE